MALQAKFEKVVQGIKTSGPKFLKELREFDNLVKVGRSTGAMPYGGAPID